MDLNFDEKIRTKSQTLSSKFLRSSKPQTPNTVNHCGIVKLKAWPTGHGLELGA